MIEGNDSLGYELICDECGEVVDGFEEFMDAVEYKKENNWKSVKVNGEWLNICPDCSKHY